jgi:hypothetical protein
MPKRFRFAKGCLRKANRAASRDSLLGLKELRIRRGVPRRVRILLGHSLRSIKGASLHGCVSRWNRIVLEISILEFGEGGDVDRRARGQGILGCLTGTRACAMKPRKKERVERHLFTAELKSRPSRSRVTLRSASDGLGAPACAFGVVGLWPGRG